MNHSLMLGYSLKYLAVSSHTLGLQLGSRTEAARSTGENEGRRHAAAGAADYS